MILVTIQYLLVTGPKEELKIAGQSLDVAAIHDRVNAIWYQAGVVLADLKLVTVPTKGFPYPGEKPSTVDPRPAFYSYLAASLQNTAKAKPPPDLYIAFVLNGADAATSDLLNPVIVGPGKPFAYMGEVNRFAYVSIDQCIFKKDGAGEFTEYENRRSASYEEFIKPGSNKAAPRLAAKVARAVQKQIADHKNANEIIKDQVTAQIVSDVAHEIGHLLGFGHTPFRLGRDYLMFLNGQQRTGATIKHDYLGLSVTEYVAKVGTSPGWPSKEIWERLCKAYPYEQKSPESTVEVALKGIRLGKAALKEIKRRDDPAAATDKKPATDSHGKPALAAETKAAIAAETARVL